MKSVRNLDGIGTELEKLGNGGLGEVPHTLLGAESHCHALSADLRLNSHLLQVPRSAPPFVSISSRSLFLELFCVTSCTKLCKWPWWAKEFGWNRGLERGIRLRRLATRCEQLDFSCPLS